MERDGQYVHGTRQEYGTRGEPDCNQPGGNNCILDLYTIMNSISYGQMSLEIVQD